MCSVLREAIKAKIRRVVLTSSVAAISDGHGDAAYAAGRVFTPDVRGLEIGLGPVAGMVCLPMP